MSVSLCCDFPTFYFVFSVLTASSACLSVSSGGVIPPLVLFQRFLSFFQFPFGINIQFWPNSSHHALDDASRMCNDAMEDRGSCGLDEPCVFCQNLFIII